MWARGEEECASRLEQSRKVSACCDRLTARTKGKVTSPDMLFDLDTEGRAEDVEVLIGSQRESERADRHSEGLCYYLWFLFQLYASYIL